MDITSIYLGLFIVLAVMVLIGLLIKAQNRAGVLLVLSVCTILGGFLGAIALSLLTVFYHWVFFRPTLGDGQYAFVFFLTVPMGAILGAMTGFVMVCLSRSEAGVAGHIAVWGGGFLLILLLFLGLFVLCGTEKTNLWDRLGATLFWCLLPLIWSVLLLWFGFRIRATSGQ